MSVIVTAYYNGGIFEVEIFRDGSLAFPGRNIEYEQTAAALGEQPSPVLQFEHLWESEPQEPAVLIFHFLEIEKTYKIKFAADCVEHVAHFYQEIQKDNKVNNIVEMIMKFIDGKLELVKIQDARYDINNFVTAAEENDSFRWFTACEAAAAASEWLAYGVEHGLDRSERGGLNTLELAASMSRESAATGNSGNTDHGSEKWKQALLDERDWQIRRFVDCMEAIGQGLPWPPLEATT